MNRAIVPRVGGLVLLAFSICFGVHVVAQAPQSPQSPPSVTFQTEVNYVDVDTIVTDQQGNFVSNLSKDDFEVLEDGKPQKIDNFSLVDIPVERQDRFLISGTPVTTDVQTNRRAFTGRVYVIVLDDIDISPMRSPHVKKAAREFVERYFGANDVGSVVYTSGRTDAAQEFTGNPQLLLAAIDKFLGRRIRSAALEYIDKLYQNQLTSSGTTDSSSSDSSSNSSSSDIVQRAQTSMQTDDLERQFRATGVLDTLKNVSEFLSSVRGRRKAMVLFSEGIDYPINDIFGVPSDTTIIRLTRDAITAAARADVNIFTIDPRGLVGMTDDEFELSGALGLPGAPNDPTGSDPKTSFSGRQIFLDEMRLSQDSLRTLAEETGGIAAVNRNVFGPTFERIVQANSHYYVLGYYPPTHPRDGKFHNIQVRVKGPGLKVTARKGYASPRGKTPEEKRRDDDARRARDSKNGSPDNTSAEVRDVLNSPMQQGGLTFAVQAAPFKNTAKEASVALSIELDGGGLQFTPQNNNATFTDKIEVSFFDVNDQGKAHRGVRTELNLTLRPETYQRVRTNGVRVNPRITLEPGRYQIRIGTRESGAGRVGSVFYDLQVPDFTKDPLMISGLLLSAPSAEQTPTAQPDPTVQKLLPGAPTSRREFLRSDTLSLLAEIYDNSSSRQPRTIDTVVRLLSETGTEAFVARDSLANTGDAKKWDVYAYTRAIPLNDVAPGRYLLRVEAQVRSSGNNSKPATRETILTVR
jgi:VWFA-related protein